VNGHLLSSDRRKKPAPPTGNNQRNALRNVTRTATGLHESPERDKASVCTEATQQTDHTVAREQRKNVPQRINVDEYLQV